MVSGVKLFEYLGYIDTLLREKTLSKLVLLSSKKGSSLTGKNLLPLGANSFLSEKIPF